MGWIIPSLTVEVTSVRCSPRQLWDREGAALLVGNRYFISIYLVCDRLRVWGIRVGNQSLFALNESECVKMIN